MMFNLCLVECETKHGDPCVFPFYYNGTQHYECIFEQEHEDKDIEEVDRAKKWCAIEVTRDGVDEFKRDYCPGNLVLNVQCYFNHEQG